MPLSQNVQARALLHHLLEHGDMVGTNPGGRTIIQLSVNDYVLETLLTFEAQPADLETEPDDQEDGSLIVVDLVRPKMVEREAGHTVRLSPMARRATIQLKVHRQVVQSIPLDEADIESLIQGLRLVTPCTQRIDRLIDLFEQIREGSRQDTRKPG